MQAKGISLGGMSRLARVVLRGTFIVFAVFAMAGSLQAEPVKQLRCKTVTGEVEGFFRDSIVWASEKNRTRAIAAEKARRRAMGQEVVKVELHETVCKETYPIGLKEWHCVAKADVCVKK